MFLGRSLSPRRTRTSTLTDPKIMKKETHIPPSGSLGMMVSGATPSCTYWFLKLHGLPTGDTLPYNACCLRVDIEFRKMESHP